MRTPNSRLAKIMRPREKTCVPIRVILRFRELCVCLSVCPSGHRFHVAGSISTNFFKLAMRVDIGRSVLGLQMGKFWQISTELLPLIDIRNWFSLSTFGIPLPIFFKLGMRDDIVKECSGIADG